MPICRTAGATRRWSRFCAWPGADRWTKPRRFCWWTCWANMASARGWSGEAWNPERIALLRRLLSDPRARGAFALGQILERQPAVLDTLLGDIVTLTETNGLTERAPSWIVPEHLAQITGKLRRRLLQHRERRVGVPPRERCRPLSGGQPSTRLERAPRPFAIACAKRSFVSFVERFASDGFVSAGESDRAAHDARERFVLAEPVLA